MSDSNYPDDIRDYDNDPRSPFYDDRDEEEIDDRSLEVDEDVVDKETIDE